MSARKIDAGIPFRPRKRVFENNPYAPSQPLMQAKMNPPRELMDPRIRHKYLACPVCNKQRQYNPRIDAVICVVCDLIWYRGKKYSMKNWDKKWETKLDRSVRSF